jgi:hypothetical protein
VLRLRWALGLTGVAAVAIVGYTGHQALQAKDALETVAAEFEQIATSLRTGDEQTASASLEVAQEAATKATENTQGPGWWLTSRLPGVGDDVAAVRTVADVTDVLASDVLPDVVVASERLDPDNLRPTKGRIAIRPLVEVAPGVVAADEEMQRQAGRVAAIRTEDLNPELAKPVGLMQSKLAEAASLSSKASYAVRLLPTMLGADGERTYLILFQNNAEIRATGGIPGAFATMTANRGRISLGTQGSSSDIGRLERPALRVTEEERALFGEKMALFPQNVNFTPDFPRSAGLVRAMWKQSGGGDVDGVVSVDPVALSHLLEGMGPVALPGGERLTPQNTVPLLLQDIYHRLPDPADQDVFFAAAARSVFDKAVTGGGDPAALLAALSRSASEGRIYVWSADDAEQTLLAETALGGRIPRDGEGARPFVGVFLNDGTGAKMQYYLDHRVDVSPQVCNREGRQELAVRVTLESRAPKDPSRLPPYVVGMAEELGVRPGAMRVNVHLYAPLGGWIDSSAYDGEERPLHEVEHLGRPVGSRTVEIAPGQTRELTYTVMTGLDQTGEVDLRVTPGVRGSGAGEVGASACNAG